MAIFKNKYRIESTRLKNWDYSRQASYFITICTANREHFFGKIENQGETACTASLSAIGIIVEQEWIKTPDIRPDMNLELGEFVVMPNHFHGIIFIYKNEFGPQSKNLSSILRGFKSAVTIQARKINPEFGWQSRFHDHIIRNTKSYDAISQYIIDNPKKWVDDEFNK